jgi:hypothetical protein
MLRVVLGPVLAADETPVNLLDRPAGLDQDEAGAPHVLVVRTPHAGLAPGRIGFA